VEPDVQIFEVSLRDGLQNEPTVVATEDKLACIERLIAAGVADIEVTSLVRPDRVPALADAELLLRSLPVGTGTRFWALVPNEVGMDRALAAGVRGVCTVVSASETHNKKNINRSVRESLAEIKRMLGLASEEGVRVRAYISTVFGCPYEGCIPFDRTVEIAERLLSWGAETIVLGDTVGTGLPNGVTTVVRALVDHGVPLEKIALHAHDTRGTALVDVYAAWRAGVVRFDASLAGIGGCPYAPGASGNLATEDLVHLFEGMGVHTGIRLDALVNAGREMSILLGHQLPGRVHQALAQRGQPLRRSA